MKKTKILLGGMMAAVLLAGCGAKTAAPAETTTAATTTVATAVEETTKSAETNAETASATLSAPGFESHGDVAFATAEVDSNGDLVALDINEYYGIRSIGRIVNNLSKANEEELAKVDAIAEDNKVYSEDGKYANYKYVMIDNRYFECVDPGKSLYKEIGEGASIEDLQTYLLENTDWWCEAMASAAETGATLKVAESGDEVLVEIDGVSLAKMDDLHSFYGGLTKKEGYTKNFSEAGTATAWAESIDLLEKYILNDKGVTTELSEVANADTTEKFLDTVSGATFGFPAIYVNLAQETIDAAKAEVK